jgi:hypothetical protein
MLLCCIGCAIFGITEVSTDGIHFDAASDFAYTNAEAGTGAAPPSHGASIPSPPVYVPPPPQSASAQPAGPSIPAVAPISFTTAAESLVPPPPPEPATAGLVSLPMDFAPTVSPNPAEPATPTGPIDELD